MSKLGFFLSKKVGKAICDFKMINENDRIAVGVSGGKDSLSLLKILQERRRITPVKYKVIALHLDMGYGCIHSSKMENFFKENGYEYHIKKIDILSTVAGDRSKIGCFWCSWNRRKHLFQLASKYRCNKLALGHHMDDALHTLLLNLFFQADFSSMSPNQKLFAGKIHIIRPLVYANEGELELFAKESNFPLACCKCPNAGKNNRVLMRNILNEVEKVCPHAKINLFRSLCRDERFLKGYPDKAKRKEI